MATHTIRTTFQPGVEKTVGEVEYQYLLREGLIYDGTPPDPVADFWDGILADKVVNGEAFPEALADAAADESSPFGSGLRAALVTVDSDQTITGAKDFTQTPTVNGVALGSGGGGAVDSVNGQTGTVVLDAADVGAQPAGSYATATQGGLADTAVQPGDLAAVATSGAYDDLTGVPTIPDSPGDIGAAPAGEYLTYVGSGAAMITDAATARPTVDGPVYWLCAAGVTPTNAAAGDLIWNADA